jgi:glutathione synthase/RimK-type ligase-like ATP-grasp enzyme
MKMLLIVPDPRKWSASIPGVTVVSPHAYLTDPAYAAQSGTRIINLSASYRYQSLGYYVSLLAAARNQRPMPSVATLRDMQSVTFYRYVSEDLEELIQKALAPLAGAEFTLSIYFGRNMAHRYEKLCLRLFNSLPAPLIRAQFAKNRHGHWHLRRFSAIPLSDVPESHLDFLGEAARQYCARPLRAAQHRRAPRYSLAMLVAPGDPLAPSNPAALARFAKAGAKLDTQVETLTREDFTQVAEYDALFIRATTQVNNFTFRFARLAEMENMPVIDDSRSILRCTNKVFLAEFLEHNRIAAPRTLILNTANLGRVAREIGYPCILKQPDSAFSIGVVKAAGEEEFRHKAREMLEKSELIVVQEFLPTDFDWRVGVLAGTPLYACKYFMAEHHWQIYNHAGRTEADRTGFTETLPIERVPPAILRTAVRGARLIGDGLYGVDIKEHAGQPYVIEINDNPSIDHGIEDEVLGMTLYEQVIQEFLRRIRALREGGTPNGARA